MGFPGGSVVKNLPVNGGAAETRFWYLGWDNPLEKETAAHSSILAWEIPWTEEPGRLHRTRDCYSPWGGKKLDKAEQLSTQARNLGEVIESLFAFLVFICKMGVILVAISSMEKQPMQNISILWEVKAVISWGGSVTGKGHREASGMLVIFFIWMLVTWMRSVCENSSCCIWYLHNIASVFFNKVF